MINKFFVRASIFFTIILAAFYFMNDSNLDVITDISDSERFIFNQIKSQCPSNFDTCKINLSGLLQKNKHVDLIVFVVGLGEMTEITLNKQKILLKETFLSSQIIFFSNHVLIKQEAFSAAFNHPLKNSVTICSRVVFIENEAIKDCKAGENFILNKEHIYLIAHQIKLLNDEHYYIEAVQATQHIQP